MKAFPFSSAKSEQFSIFYAINNFQSSEQLNRCTIEKLKENLQNFSFASSTTIPIILCELREAARR